LQQPVPRIPTDPIPASTTPSQPAAALTVQSTLYQLRTEVEHGKKSLAAKQQEYSAAQTEIGKLKIDLEQSRSDVRLLRAELATARDETERIRAEHDGSLKRIGELEQQLAATSSKSRRSRPAPERIREGDDLTAIKGIGQKLEKALNAAGIHRYAEIAAWTDTEVESLAPKLKIRPDRIRRERWIERARELSQQS
jgi:predicted flap endonuclease-1-like 5' DNA nuclease